MNPMWIAIDESPAPPGRRRLERWIQGVGGVHSRLVCTFLARAVRLPSLDTTLSLGMVAALCLLSVSASGAPVRLEVRPGSDGTEIVFASKAPMESFEGRTKQIQGVILLDPAALGDSIEVRIEVDLASLDTGISLRNQHMRENHLQTATYPKATFGGATLTGFPKSLVSGETAHGTGRGSFDLHGVVRPIEADVALTLRADGSLAVHATFQVFLADYGIDRPKFLLLKLDEKQQITVDLLARPAGVGGAKK